MEPQDVRSTLDKIDFFPLRPASPNITLEGPVALWANETMPHHKLLSLSLTILCGHLVPEYILGIVEIGQQSLIGMYSINPSNISVVNYHPHPRERDKMKAKITVNTNPVLIFATDAQNIKMCSLFIEQYTYIYDHGIPQGETEL